MGAPLAQEERAPNDPLFTAGEEATPRTHFSVQYNLEARVSEKLTLVGWYAHNHGKPWPYAGKNSLWFAGYDWAPGFKVDMGQFQGFDLGWEGEIFFRKQERLDEKDSTYIYDTEDFTEYRPTLGLSVGYPVAFWFYMKHTSRWERRVLKTPALETRSQYRPRFQVTIGRFAPVANLSFYGYYEGFEQGDFVAYRSEAEFGATVEPIPSFELQLGSRYRNLPEKENQASWLFSLNLSYRFDLTGNPGFGK